MLGLGRLNSVGSDPLEEAKQVAGHFLFSAQEDVKAKALRVIKRSLNWRLAMSFEAWSTKAKSQFSLVEMSKTILRRWLQNSLSTGFNRWKSNHLFSKMQSALKKQRKLASTSASSGLVESQASKSVATRPKSDDCLMPALRPFLNGKQIFQDIRTPLISSNSTLPSEVLRGRRFVFRSSDASRATREFLYMLHERSDEILDSFRGTWNNFELFSEYGDSGRSADGGILTRYSLRSLGRRAATMDFQELLSLLHSEGLLSERGGVVDPSKLSVSTVHSVFRVVNLKCYSSWFTTLRAKKTIDSFDGAADKYELGFREYQMVRPAPRPACTAQQPTSHRRSGW
jgi:hypothetical protein